MADKQRMRVFLGFAGATALASALGGFWTDESVRTWYPTLIKPSWTPPPFVFGPVWTLLYAAMAIAAWRVWKVAGWKDGRTALVWYFVQLVLNAAWSYLFFALRNPAYGSYEIVLLWASILVTLVLFFKKDRLAGWLLVPYLLWVSYASTLTFGIWHLN